MMPILLYLQDSEGRTALHWACDRGHVDLLRILLDRSASVDLQDSDGQSGLHYAVACEHVEITEMLVKAGADINKADADGDSPLSSASKKMKPLLLG
jgi:ankyrin repeat protein